ncbi:hypothetical protein [Parasitella parasitica]|uniref:Rab-GAP TBC domain-containing protein n=1 Tax=Parasitella parasitica TaxID=35722 RepID=A0A0B7NPK8_9FUNG|nr:hypothetical protein [Parasitella parasitica]
MKEQNSFIQYISLSANHIFRRKSHTKDTQETAAAAAATAAAQVQPYNVINRSLSDMTVSTFGSSSISDQDDDDDDDNDFTPIPSASSSTIDSSCHHKDEPWRLHPYHVNNRSEYFFQDRDEKQHDNDNCSVSIERDSYGFKRPTQWIKLEHLRQFDAYYQPILDSQLLKWKAMMHNAWPAADSIKLRKNVRQGIPSEFRSEAWLHYSGAKSKMEANPELYQALVQTAMLMGDHNEHAEIIQRDLHRTFPDNEHFACVGNNGSMLDIESNPKLQSLRRILLAFSLHSPQIGYCQSLNYLAGFFLLFCKTEQDAFWMLVTTVHDYLPENMYDVTMEGANIDQSVLMMLAHEHMPEIYNKISSSAGCFWQDSNKTNKGLPPITLVTSHWFLTMFINILPIETVLRIWDCVFVEGYSIMFQTALTIMKMNSEKIAAVQDSIEIFQILQNMPRRLIDCHQFMNMQPEFLRKESF